MRPTPRCVLLFAGGIPVALLAAVVSPRLWTLWIAWLGLSLAACALDALLAPGRRSVRLRAAFPDRIFIGESGVLRLTVGVSRRVRSVAEAVLDLDPRFEAQPPARILLESGDARAFEFRLTPTRRGNLAVEALWLRWTGPLGLVRRQTRRRLAREIAVVPDVGAVRRTALRLFASREFLTGLKVERYVGDGSEFESLREYVPGLEYRAMNWKASARHRTLICTEYRAERNHQVVLALDTGHLMSEPLSGIPRLDHAINAALQLAYVSLRTGDRVGWLTFDASVHAFREPEGGTSAFRRLQHLSAEVAYTRSETNFTLGLTDLCSRLRRRSLIVLLTDFVDTVTAELMVENLERTARRHLILFVALRDPALDAMSERMPERIDDLYRAVVSGDFVRERDLVLRRLRQSGVHCIDAFPERITTTMLNRYMEIKRRELL